MASIAQHAIADNLIAASRPRRGWSVGAVIAADLLALLGVSLIGVSLFLHDWVHAHIVFVSQGQVASRILQVVGIDVDREIARIADREIAKTLPPTLWQYEGHALQRAFALLVVVAVLLLVALAFTRVRVAAQVGAVLAGAGAIGVIVAAFMTMHRESDSLPAQVAQAVLNSSIGNRVLGLTTGTPTLEIQLGWPLYVGAAGLGLMVLGVLFGLIFAVTRAVQMRQP